MSRHALPSPFLFAPAHVHSHAPMARARVNQYTYDSLDSYVHESDSKGLIYIFCF